MCQEVTASGCHKSISPMELGRTQWRSMKLKESRCHPLMKRASGLGRHRGAPAGKRRVMFSAKALSTKDEAAIDARGSAAARAVSPFLRRTIPVSSIVVGEGFAQDFTTSYIDMLAEIVRKYGLREAITITADGRLVAGARWFAAIRKLGWDTVEVAIVHGEA